MKESLKHHVALLVLHNHQNQTWIIIMQQLDEPHFKFPGMREMVGGGSIMLPEVFIKLMIDVGNRAACTHQS